MEWNEYQKEAFKTNANMGSFELDNYHMMAGMFTEVGELVDVFKKNLAYGKKIDWKNVKEEIGDFFWYVAGFAQFNGIDLTERFDELLNYKGYLNREDFSNTSSTLGIMAHVGRVSSVMYNPSQYEKDDYGVKDAIQPLLYHMFLFCHINEFNVERILENNIEKLRERYPENFTEESALIRDLDAEAEILDE